MLTYPVILDLMPRKRNSAPVASGMSTKQMKRRKPINSEYLKGIEPLTENQEKFFHDYGLDQNMFAYGAAGTGKTFIALYLALKDVLDENSPYEKIYIVRSLVATREIGFLPGDHEDKSSLYQIPYKNMVKYMFKMPDDNSFELLYTNLKAQGTVSFWSTSFIRGTTFDNAIVIVDECQNCNFHELDSIITRIGLDTKVIFCGDYYQSDFKKDDEKEGLLKFLTILEQMRHFRQFTFGWDDIVRSDLVRDYIMTKEMLEIR